MTAEGFFRVTNTLALAAWIALLLFPGKKLVSGWLCAVIVPGLLALGYAGVIGWKLVTNAPPTGDIMTLTGLRDVFSDDWVFGPERAVQALVDAFASAPGRAELRRLHPRDIGQRRVGHFAPFARHVGERLWPSWFDELEAAVPALRARR